jgi:hypothetical protein
MNTIRTFHPEKMSRRAEAILWGLAAISMAGWILLRTQNQTGSPWNLVFVVLMVLSAASITLGNWMDRNTVLTLRPEGLDFRNGLRDIHLRWDEIQEVRVLPSNWGNQAHILGKETGFNFRTLSKVQLKGKSSSRMGFAQGMFIIERILENSGLKEIEQPEKGHYYARP